MKNNLSSSCYDLINRTLRERRTVHNFEEKGVSDELIENAVESMRWAPNHYLTEPWRVYLLGPEVKKQIISLNSEIVERRSGPKAAKIKSSRWNGIPGWLLVNCIIDGDDLRQREDYAACCCGIQNLMLSLWSAKIGVKWTTGEVTRDTRLPEIVGFDLKKSLINLYNNN